MDGTVVVVGVDPRQIARAVNMEVATLAMPCSQKMRIGCREVQMAEMAEISVATAAAQMA